MNRRKFITKNQAKMHSYFYVVAVICVLLILFVAIGNATTFVSAVNLDGHVETNANLEKNLSIDADEQQEKVEESNEELTTLKSNTEIFLFGSGEAYNAVKNQLLIQKQNAVEISDIDDSIRSGSLLIISEKNISDSDAKVMKEMMENGVNLLFLQLPDNIMSSSVLKKIMGIKNISEEQTFDGMRMSDEYYAGQWMEDNREKVTAYYVKTGKQVKTYMCALPYEYADIENQDLPALVWRYIEDGECGHVYVCNGDFMDSENAYGIIPIVLEEINGSYIYPVVNAYCVFAEGLPYSSEEERDYWDRLYSRNASGILSDMIMPQLVRYTNVYGARMSVFSREYELFSTTDDSDLYYYTRMIESNQGYLGLKTDSGDYLKSEEDIVCIKPWSASYTLWNIENKKLNIPVNYTYDTTKTKTPPSIFDVAASSYGLGYYCVDIDYEDLLDYDETYDIWQDFCSELEVILGTHKENEEWMDRVTAAEAVNRMIALLNMDVTYKYTDEGIELEISDLDDEAWFILRDAHKEYSCQGCTMENIGTDCYLVTVTESNAKITWSNK